MTVKKYQLVYSQLFFTLILLTSLKSFASECTDANLIDLVKTPYVNPADVHSKLSCLEEYLLFHGDRRAIFLSVYRMVTATMAESIELGVYENKQWITDYLVIFADKYREAFYNYETKNLMAIPGSWIIAFDTAKRGENLILQDVALGMTAHITRDLAHAIHDVGIAPNQASRLRDHRKVNEYLAFVYADINLMLSDLYGPGIDDIFLEKPAGPVLAQLTGKGMVAVRDRAWLHGVLLTKMPGIFYRLVDWYIEKTSVNTAFLALSPKINPVVFKRLHEMEGSDPLSAFCSKFPCKQ